MFQLVLPGGMSLLVLLATAYAYPWWTLVFVAGFCAFVWRDLRTQRAITDARLRDEHVPSMSPAEFERFVARQLEQAGWSVRHTGRTGDQGCDVVAELRGFRAVVQVKKCRAGNAAVQEVVAARHHYGAQVMVVVALGFTPAARLLAASNGVHLMHHSQLCDLETLARIP